MSLDALRKHLADLEANAVSRAAERVATTLAPNLTTGGADASGHAVALHAEGFTPFLGDEWRADVEAAISDAMRKP